MAGNTEDKGGEAVKEFFCKTNILYGSGSADKIPEFGSQRLRVVSDPFFAENGTAEKIAENSGAEQYRIYSGVMPDPTVEQVAKGTAVVKEFRPDTVVALGGGSAMDCAKAMVYFSGHSVRFVAVPTTSGSGSEVTDFAILTHEGVKYPLIDETMRPDVAILDSNFLKNLPPKLIADTGFDVISHALEAYVAKNSSPVTDALSADAFRTALTNLLRSYQGDCSVRGDMHMASCMAGMAFTQAGLGLCHAMSHTLGGMFHVPHGRLNGILLPAVIQENAAVAADRYAEIASLAGLGGAAQTVAVRNLKNSLIRLRSQLQMPGSLAQAGVDTKALQRATEEIVRTTLLDPCCQTNPVPVTGDMIVRILKEVTGTV